MLEAFVVIFTVCLIVTALSQPFRKSPDSLDQTVREQELARLNELKAAKYREIHDAELEFQTGKLSKADYQQVDNQLRAEAVDILREIDSIL